ncbi:MAG: exosome complex exonuclease Rrp41 [archaeon]
MEKPKWLIKDGVRLDGRSVDGVRPMKIVAGFLEKADGSCYIECGKTKVVVGVHGPREVHPKHDEAEGKAIVRCTYDMAAFSVDAERKRPGNDRRSIEISKVASQALEAAIFTERFPKTAIDVFMEVIQADASTRVAAITAAAVALADAGIPMRDLVSACSFGKLYGENGEEVIAVDMDKPEDNFGWADCAVAYMPAFDQFTLMQMDGNLTLDEIKLGMEMVKKSCRQIYELQKAALKRRYE